jgi:hypothetical protein
LGDALRMCRRLDILFHWVIQSFIVEELLANPGVTPPSDGKRFGSSGLKIHQKLFAMLVRGKLVVKLPKPRVVALIVEGVEERFDPRHDGRLMREWVSVEPTSEEEWLNLSKEAMEFVASRRSVEVISRWESGYAPLLEAKRPSTLDPNHASSVRLMCSAKRRSRSDSCLPSSC